MCIGCDVQNIIVVSKCFASEDTWNDWVVSNKKKEKRKGLGMFCNAVQEKQDSSNMQIWVFLCTLFTQVFNLQSLNFKFRLPRLSSWSTIIQNQISINTFYVHNLFPAIQAKKLEDHPHSGFNFFIKKAKPRKFCKYIVNLAVLLASSYKFHSDTLYTIAADIWIACKRFCC